MHSGDEELEERVGYRNIDAKVLSERCRHAADACIAMPMRPTILRSMMVASRLTNVTDSSAYTLKFSRNSLPRCWWVTVAHPGAPRPPSSMQILFGRKKIVELTSFPTAKWPKAYHMDQLPYGQKPQ